MASKMFRANLGISPFYQCGQSWSSEKTSCGKTMCEEGCYITSAAMVLTYNGYNVDPGTLRNAIKPYDCPIDFSVVATRYRLKYTRVDKNFEKIRADIFDYLYYSDTPVMIGVSGSNTHMVVAQGFSGTLSIDPDGNPNYSEITPSMILVNDPGSKNRTTLAQVLTSYPTVTGYRILE
ncbi:C39 family peptidase [Brevibacillus ruminantium]|uniref:C39 family peptidase n=1 Tax=Brevibacillus ruminantium TaxID=2950604 RepID=A0ABY4WII7_9BACL|nr:C39 family peptidase [Brevibacillus ruminantium]USG64451.1 C39 family peptidase [Brevibacillus ruminantium]